MPPSRFNDLPSNRFLGRLGLTLILLFVVNTLFGLFPLQILDPAWRLRVADLLRTTAPFTLLGAALIYLCEGPLDAPGPSWLPLRRIQRLAPLAALGFLLLIPLQIHASWTQINTADSEAQKTIRTVERRIAAVRAVDSSSDLLKLSKGLPPDWQPLANESLEVNRTRLLGRVEPELARLRNLASDNKSAVIQKRLQDGLRDQLLSLIYAVAFYGLRPMRSAAAQLNQAGMREGDDPMFDSTLTSGSPGDRNTSASQVPSASSLDSSDQDQPDIGNENRHPWFP